MPKPHGESGQKNLIAKQLRILRAKRHMSQRGLAMEFQLRGYDIDKNVITRIENNQRYVSDIELQELLEIFKLTYDELMNMDVE